MTSETSPGPPALTASSVDIFAGVPPSIYMNEAISQSGGRHLILFDGVCGLCNRFNSFVLPRDVRGVFHFAPIQSELARSTLLHFGRNPDVLDSFHVVVDYRSASPRLRSKAEAALFVARELGGIWRLSTVLQVLPVSLLNGIYDLIARHRYRIFGRYDNCTVPKDDYRNRFVDM